MDQQLTTLASLPLPERLRLITGSDSWHTAGSAIIGLRPMAASDGPSGVRGAALDERHPSNCLPCMPVLMPWLADVAAVLYAWLPGQAMGEALAGVLLGAAEPGGRLPVTLPAAEADCPVLHAVPRHGRLDYAEGLLIGYRGFDAAGTDPLFPFGHGTGYTSWSYGHLSLVTTLLAPGEDLRLRVRVRNTGTRPGREVVQVYVAPGKRRTGRPLRVLGACGTARAEPGEERELALKVPARLFATFDATAGEWIWPAGPFTVEVGRSSRDLRLTAEVWSG